MDVLLVSSGSGSSGGGEIYLAYLARGLAAEGVEVGVLLPDDRAMDALAARLPPAARVIRQPLRPTYRRPLRCLGAVGDGRQVAGLAARLEALGPRLLHVNQQVAEDGLDHLLAARRSGLPLVTTIHVAHSPAALGARGGTLRTALARRVLRRGAEPIVTVSGAARTRLLAWSGVAPSRVRVAHNGTPAPAEDPEARRRIGERHRIPDGALRLLVLGRLEAQKGPEQVLAVLRWLQAQGLASFLCWVGDGSRRGAFERALAAEGLSARAVVTGWRESVDEYLRASDVLLLPSRFEGLPLALLEAMHAGLAIVARPVDGIVEAVADGVEARLVAAEDAAAWGAAVRELAAHPERRARLGRAAAARAAADFSLRSMTCATRKIYASVGAAT